MAILEVISDYNVKIGLKKLFDKLNEVIRYLNVFAPVAYKKYVALLTQTGTNAPVATILQNSIGNVVLGYNAAGNYTASSNGLFTLNKTTIVIGSNVNINVFDYAIMQTNTLTDSSFFIVTLDTNTSASDDLLLNTLIEITVYP
jgi:hypothetical protein